MVKSLVIDFNNYNGHHMTFSRKEPFQKADLHGLEAAMLRDNAISMLLPLTWLEVNEELSFQYKIDGYRLLTHYLRKQQLTMLSYYSLLLSITDALATCYEYMLRPECCIIDEHVLYIDELQERLLFPYLPLQEPVYEHQSQQLLLLAVRWAELVNDLDAEGYHRILYLLSDGKLAITPLRQLLLDLIHQQTTTQHKSTMEHIKALDKTVIDKDSPLAVIDQSLSSVNTPGNNSLAQAHEKEAVFMGPSSAILSDDSDKEHSEATSSASHYDQWEGLDEEDLYNDHLAEHTMTWKHYMLTLVLLTLLAIAWYQLYVVEQTFENLLLCSGLSIGLMALLGIALHKPLKASFSSIIQKRRAADEEGAASSMMNEDVFVAEYAENEKMSSKLYSWIGTPHSYQSEQQPVDSPFTNYEEQPARQRSSQKARMVDTMNPQSINQHSYDLATVQLDEAQVTSMLQGAELLLVRSMNGTEEQIPVAGSTFLIGRAEEGVHYRESAKGVSRVHIEFELINGKLHVKDAGSRNGTFLNGQLMIAYKAYPLKKGDKLQLASREGPIYERVS